MAKKIKNPEMLVAEIHTQKSKYDSLRLQHKANEAKIARLQSTNKAISAKAEKLRNQMETNMAKARQNGIPF